MKGYITLFICLKKFESVASREMLRVSRCCKSKSTNPTANSTAEKIKKKKVRDKIFKLSNISPINNEIPYRVIHNNSAVNNK